MPRTLSIAVVALLASCAGAHRSEPPPHSRAPFPGRALGYDFGTTLPQAEAACAAAGHDWHAYPSFPEEASAFCSHPDAGTSVSLLFGAPPRLLHGVSTHWGAASRDALAPQLDALTAELRARYGAPTRQRGDRGVLTITWELRGGTVGLGVSGATCAVGPGWTLALVYDAAR